MKIDSADKFLDLDQFKASLLCASLQTRSRWKNSLTLAKDRWKYQGGNYKVSINALNNKQEL